MNKYELVLIVAPNLTDEEVKATAEKAKSVIEGNGGVIDNVDDWGKRRLAYEINDFSEAFYFLVNFTSSPELPKELDRILRITDSVIRHMIVNID
ncbi:MAG: 30S ribosomal protein S6 [Clostridium sp.]|uniref:30S ribosomal protein S6 n=1 Tax=Clostridium sp. TaxID=1506 RepID=UPI002FCBD163